LPLLVLGKERVFNSHNPLANIRELVLNQEADDNDKYSVEAMREQVLKFWRRHGVLYPVKVTVA
jgi:hypothetical protein